MKDSELKHKTAFAQNTVRLGIPALRPSRIDAIAGDSRHRIMRLRGDDLPVARVHLDVHIERFLASLGDVFVSRYIMRKRSRISR